MLWSKAIGAGGAGGLVEGWNISTAVFLQSKSVSAKESSPTSVFLSPLGTDLYTCGATSDAVHRYLLSEAFNIDTATFSESLTLGSGNPSSITFNANGTILYIGLSQGGVVVQYSLSTPWAVSTAVFSGQTPYLSKEPTSAGVALKSDGTSLFVSGYASNGVHEYSLSTPWDVATATFVKSFSFGGQKRNIFFKPDGLALFIADSSADNVAEYALSSSWDISTLSLTQSKSVALATPAGLHFNATGTKMYVSNEANGTINEYDLTA